VTETQRFSNIHGTAFVIGDRGVLVVGPSGSGKTTLALTAIRHFQAGNLFCRLVADDQLFAENHGGRLVCRAPRAIAGLIEVPGLGPQPIAHDDKAVIDLAIRLIEPGNMTRFQEQATELVLDCSLPKIFAPARDAMTTLPMLAAGFRMLCA
jgi:serine kinase of HPr protein (carbohydrate metabolism regulator)